MMPVLDPVVALMAGAVGVLWMAWSAFMYNENRQLKKDLESVTRRYEQLASFVIETSENVESLQELKKKLAALFYRGG